MTWGSDIEIERRNRIRLSIWAYAYELEDDPLVSDKQFDLLSYEIRPKMRTGHVVFDSFFATEFTPHSGMWVRKHPDLEGLKRRYEALRAS